MKVKYQKIDIQEIEQEVPDEYSYDESVRGQMVDVLLEEMCYTTRDKITRSLFDRDSRTVITAIETMKKCYSVVDKCLEVFNGNNNEPEI